MADGFRIYEAVNTLWAWQYPGYHSDLNKASAIWRLLHIHILHLISPQSPHSWFRGRGSREVMLSKLLLQYLISWDKRACFFFFFFDSVSTYQRGNCGLPPLALLVVVVRTHAEGRWERPAEEQAGVNICKGSVWKHSCPLSQLFIFHAAESMPTSPCSALPIYLLCFYACGDVVLTLQNKTYSLLSVF